MKIDMRGPMPAQFNLQAHAYRDGYQITIVCMDYQLGEQYEQVKLLPENRYSAQLLSNVAMELVLEWRPRTPLPTEKINK